MKVGKFVTTNKVNIFYDAIKISFYIEYICGGNYVSYIW
jgi:hypothetical protein